MMKLLPKTNIDFLKYRKVYFVLFALLLIGGVICFATKGFNLGIDFTGGTLVQVKFDKPVEMSVLRDALDNTGEVYLQTNAEGAQAVRAHMDVPVQQG